MPPIRFLLRCCQACEHPWPASAEPREGLLAVEMRPVRGDGDLASVAELAKQCRTIDPALAGRWSPAGLCAELRGREGRRVLGWLAESSSTRTITPVLSILRGAPYRL